MTAQFEALTAFPTSTASYEINSGNFYYGGLILRQDLKNYSLSLESGFRSGSFETSISNQDGREFKSQVGVTFPIGKEDSK